MFSEEIFENYGLKRREGETDDQFRARLIKKLTTSNDVGTVHGVAGALYDASSDVVTVGHRTRTVFVQFTRWQRLWHLAWRAWFRLTRSSSVLKKFPVESYTAEEFTVVLRRGSVGRGSNDEASFKAAIDAVLPAWVSVDIVIVEEVGGAR